MSRKKAFSTGAAVVAAAFGMTVGLSTGAYAIDDGTATYNCTWPTNNSATVTGTFTTDGATIAIEGNISGLTNTIGLNSITTTLTLNNNTTGGTVTYSGTVNDATTLPYVYLGPLPKTAHTPAGPSPVPNTPPSVGDVLYTGGANSLTLYISSVPITITCSPASTNAPFTGGLTYQ